MNHMLENYNFWNDPRTIDGLIGELFDSIDEHRMVGMVTLESFLDEDLMVEKMAEAMEEDGCFDCDELEDECTVTTTVEVPLRYEVCPRCSGSGVMVDPNIDCCGLTQEDFDCDPDLEEEYFNGAFNVTCSRCKGKRVVPVWDREKTPKHIRKFLEDKEREDREYAHTVAMERAMGA